MTKSRNRTIGIISASLAFLTFIVMNILAVIRASDYGYDVIEAFKLNYKAEGIAIQASTMLITFLASFILLWGFWRSTKKQKVKTSIGFSIPFFGLIILKFWPAIHYNYIVDDNPYDDGRFVRDPELDRPSLMALLKENEYNYDNVMNIISGDVESYGEQEDKIKLSYFSNLINSSFKTEKFNATMQGGKETSKVYYNVCLDGKKVTFKAVKIPNKYSSVSYCNSKWMIDHDEYTFVFNPVSEDQFFCEGCENYYLPIYWKFVKDK